MSELTRDGMVEPAARDRILRREWGQGNFQFDHENTGLYPRLLLYVRMAITYINSRVCINRVRLLMLLVIMSSF